MPFDQGMVIKKKAKGEKGEKLTCCSGRIEGGNWPVAKV
jgi:hypothetical protein